MCKILIIKFTNILREYCSVLNTIGRSVKCLKRLKRKLVRRLSRYHLENLLPLPWKEFWPYQWLSGGFRFGFYRFNINRTLQDAQSHLLTSSNTVHCTIH
jgi:hypothetical protein